MKERKIERKRENKNSKTADGEKKEKECDGREG